MISSLYERIKEIGIFSAVGLSPLHVASMFIAEVFLLAVVSATLGYIFGIVGVWFLDVFNLRPPGFYPSYVSAYVLIALGLSMLMTISSTFYPTRKVARLVTPSIERGWKPSSKPKGDEWLISMPFVVTTEKEMSGIMAYMKEYFEIHGTERMGLFMSRSISYEERMEAGVTMRSLLVRAQLAPWDAGIVQDIRLIAAYSPSDDRYYFKIYLKRLEGYHYTWLSANYALLDKLRQQLLIWRGLSPEERELYIAKGEKLRQ
jgi:hypothetical protein